jgi:NitT/TauT family transport system permease protein
LEEARSGIHIVHAPVQLPELAALLRAIIPAPPAPRRQVVRIVRQISPPILLIALSLCLWEAACRASGVKDYLVPPPSHVARVVLAKRSMLTRDTMATGAEALGGFLLANVLAFALAVAFSHVPWFERGFYPLVIALKSVPIVAIAPLLVLWIGYGLGSKVAMAAIIAFFPLVVNATVGLRAVEPDALDMFRSWSASKWQVLWKLRVPAAAPYIFSALRVSAALAVVGAIVGELTGARRGVGFTILMASYNVDTPLLFAGIFCAAFLGITMFLLVVLAERLVAPHTVGFEQVEGAAEPN